VRKYPLIHQPHFARNRLLYPDTSPSPLKSASHDAERKQDNVRWGTRNSAVRSRTLAKLESTWLLVVGAVSHSAATANNQQQRMMMNVLTNRGGVASKLSALEQEAIFSPSIFFSEK